ncbi:Calx-beta domain-containing protein [Haloferula sp.]|uniref:delta-60 repeat domain-containing protein n=1 Tax=Haloferula sp. TaxID=2497595 RepID=UPI00329E10A7
MKNPKAKLLPLWGLAVLGCLLAGLVRGQTVPIPFPDLRFSQSAELRSVTRLPNGKYIIAGDFIAVNDIDRNNIARLNADGTVDLTWDPSIAGTVRTVVADDHNVYAIGSFTSVGGVDRQGLAKIPLAGNGAPDPLWDPMGNTLSSGGSGAMLIVDGNLLATYTLVAAADRKVGIFDLIDGTLTQTIDFTDNFYPHVIARDGDNVYIGGRNNGAGNSGGGGATTFTSVFRYSITMGYLEDPAWFINLTTALGRPQVRDLAFDGSFVYVGGYFNGHLQGTRSNLCRFSKAAITLDSWEPGVVFPAGLGQPTPQSAAPVNTLALVDGVLHVGGLFDAIEVQAGNPSAAGSYANHVSFSTGAVGDVDDDKTASADAPIWDLEPGANSIVAAGKFGSWKGKDALSIARYFPSNGRQDPSFVSYVQGDPGIIHAFAHQPDGKLILGGKFGSVGSVSRLNLARFNIDGTLDYTWAPEVTASPNTTLQAQVSSLAISKSHVYLGGQFDLVNGTARSSLARMSYVDGAHLDTTWNPSVENIVSMAVRQEIINGLALSSSGTDIYLSGEFTQINGATRSNLAKVSTTTGLTDQSWISNYADGQPSAIAVGPSGSVFIGGVTNFQGSGQDGVARVDGMTGAADAMWNPDFTGGQDAINALQSDGSDLYVAGDFTQVNGVLQAGLTKLSTVTGAVDLAFTPTTTFPTTNRKALSLSVSDKAVCGYFTADDPTGTGTVEAMIVFNRATGGNSKQFDVIASTTRPQSTPYLGGFLVPNIARAGQDPRDAALQMLLSLRPPVIRFDQMAQKYFFEPNPFDPVGVNFFQIKTITGGTLELPDGTAVVEDDFISFDQGAAGLHWTPAPQSLGEGEETGEEVEGASAAEESSEGTSEETSSEEPSTTTTTFNLSTSSYEIDEDGTLITVTIEMSGPGSESVDFTLSGGTADSGVDYFIAGSNPDTETFASEGSQSFFVIITDDSDAEGDETFSITLSNPTGDAVLTTPSVAQVTIVDDDIIGTSGSSIAMLDPSPVDPGPSIGVLEVNLSGDSDLGGWRLVGEDTWRDSSDDAGTPASGLSTGNYVVEFRPADDLLEPSDLTIPVDGSTATATVGTGAYASVGLFSSGVASLSAILEPSALATESVEADRAQWRRQGETSWRDTEDIITGLTPGLHIVEFKPVSGRVTPADRLVYCQADQTNFATAVYLYETNLTGVSQPAVLDFSPSSPGDPAVLSTPYQFTGQIYTEQGYGSGIVTKEHTVLTAAHVLFDDTTLSHVTDVYWFHQRHRGDHDLPPVEPRGWYRFESYATQRATDVEDPSYGPGVGSPTSQNLDAAAMYFLSPAGRSGYSGYLASNDTSTNEWLISSRDKLLVCYPMEGITPGDRGKMAATTVANDTYTHLQNYVFKTSDYKTAPGGSGAPIFVRADDTELYPAAIYLGGTGDSTVRSIDDDVVDLMNRAETAGSGGGNSTGGGATYTSPGTTEDPFSQGNVTANTAGTDSGSWRVVDAMGDPLTSYIDSGSLLAMPPGDLNVEFSEVAGMVAPSERSATVYSSQITQLDVTYTQSMASWTEKYLTDEGVTSEDGTLDDYDDDTIVHLLERAFNLVPTVSDYTNLTPGTGTSGLPAIYLDDLGSGERLTIEYIRMKSTIATDLTYSPVFADTLGGSFSASAETEAVTEIDSLWERVIIQDDYTTSQKTERFGRVEVEVTP